MVNQEEIHRKALSSKVEEHREAVWQLWIDFASLPDKEQAGEDLHRLAHDEDEHVLESAASVLGTAFPHIPDKEQAGEDLHRLTREGWYVRRGAARALGTAFPHIPNKEQAWEDLIRLTQDEDSDIRWFAADALGPAFLHIPDKEQAWKDLHRLTQDEDWHVREHAAYVLGSAFPYIPDKKRAWKDLHRLTGNGIYYVRWGAAHALGSAFPYIPNKKQALKDLHRLTGDKDSPVRIFANHSLGRASIFKATETENEEGFREEMKNALEFFERSSKEATHLNPSKFCLLFYSSFYKIMFEKAGAEDEVQKYLAEAKRVMGGSKTKETLLKAVENLANALSEAQKVTDFNTMKSELNAYRQYCGRAADLIDAAVKGAPGAARVLQRGLPIINDRIKETIREIQGNTRAICKETRGTILQDMGIELNRQGDNLSKTQNPIELDKKIDILLSILLKMCARISDGETGLACEMLEKAKNEPFTENRIDLMSIASANMLPYIGDIKMSIKIGKIENSTGVQIGVEHSQKISAASDQRTSKHDKHKFSLREIIYGIIIDIAIHVLVIIPIDYYLESSIDKIVPYLIITLPIVLVITVFALHKLPDTKPS